MWTKRVPSYLLGRCHQTHVRAALLFSRVHKMTNLQCFMTATSVSIGIRCHGYKRQWELWPFQWLPFIRTRRRSHRKTLSAASPSISLILVGADFPNKSRLRGWWFLCSVFFFSPSPAAGGRPVVLDGPRSLHWPGPSAPLRWKRPHRPPGPQLLQTRGQRQLRLLLTRAGDRSSVWQLPHCCQRPLRHNSCLCSYWSHPHV